MFKRVSEWAKNHKTGVWIFVLAFGVRFLYAVFVQLKFGGHGFIAHADAFSFYLRGAENLINHHIFSLNTNPPYMPDAYRTPLYTLFVAFFLWLKSPFFFIVLAQNIMAGFISVLIYRIGLLLNFSYGVSIFAAVLTALEPASIYWNNLLMSDYLFAFLFILACYEFFLGRYYWFGALIGLAALTRPTGLYFLPLFLLMSPPWRKFILAAAIFLLVLFPWALRNKIAFDTWDITSASWYNLYGVLLSRFAHEQSIVLPKPPLPADYPNPQTFVYDPANAPFYKQHFFEIVKSRPLAYLRFHAGLAIKSRFVNYYQYLADYVLKPKFPSLFYGVPGFMIYFAVAAGGIFWIVIYVLMFIGFFEKKRRAEFLAFSGMVAVIMFTAGATGMFGADGSRFILPLQPFMFLFAGLGLNRIFLFCRAPKFL